MLLNDSFRKNLFIQSYKQFCEAIEKYRAFCNIFICATTINGNENGQADKLCKRQVIFLDFDKKDYPIYKDVRDFSAHIKQRIPELYNHAIIDSGNGYHFYIAIEPTDDLERLLLINRQIAAIVGADTDACKSTQVMRIPETRNLKDGDNKPVSVVSNSFGNDKFRPYSLKKLEAIIQFIQKNDEIRNELPQREYNADSASYYCIEKMLAEGAVKGDRNFCLGRITKYLKNVKGYEKYRAEQVIRQWNERCRPVKDINEVIADFERYWDGNYNLLGCTIPQESRQATLTKYCDRYSCKTILNGEAMISVAGKEIEMDNQLITNLNLRKLSGYHYLILTVLHMHEKGLSLKQLKKELTVPQTNRLCLDERTLRSVLSDLVNMKYISNDKRFFRLVDLKNYGAGYTRYYYSITVLLIHKILLPSEYLVYLTLVRNLQRGKDVSYSTLADELNIVKQNVRRAIIGLHEKKALLIEKVYLENGVLANRYVLTA